MILIIVLLLHHFMIFLIYLREEGEEMRGFASRRTSV
jgi:hypothetical protein